jgi:hypothetical protein
MKELDLWVFVAVFEEMLGPWLWVLVGWRRSLARSPSSIVCCAMAGCARAGCSGRNSLLAGGVAPSSSCR